MSDKTTERDFLVNKYLPYAATIARITAQSLSGNVNFDDILGDARFGLLEAARRFDARLHFNFKTYAQHRIRGAIYDGLRKSERVPRHFYSANSSLPAVVVSIDDPDDFEKADPDARQASERQADLRAMRQKILHFVQRLPLRERQLIMMYYFKGSTIGEIALSLHLSKSWLSRLHSRALSRLYRKMTN